MPHIVSSSVECATQRPRRTAPSLADQDHRLALRDACRIELGQRVILGTGDVAATELMRLADINDDTTHLALGPHQFVVLNSRNAR
jgi:hypothetical protein